MIPEAAYAMLACARIGAIHSVVFGGFSPSALKDRILDSDCEMLITADEGIRGGRIIPLKLNADEALEQCQEGGDGHKIADYLDSFIAHATAANIAAAITLATASGADPPASR